MKALLVSLFVVGFGLQTFGGQKTTWNVDLLEKASQNQSVKVSSLSYSAATLAQGEVYELNSGMLFFVPLVNANKKIHGHLIATLKRTTGNSGVLRFEVWDTTGFDDNSPFFKSYFVTEQPLNVGEESQIEFTQGDPSKRGESVTYTAIIKLLSSSSCKDNGDCLTPSPLSY